MEPTRPSDSTPARQTKLPQPSSPPRPQTSPGAPPPAVASRVADSVEASAGTLHMARAEVSRLDDSRLDAIRAAIADGSYSVDPEALADRLLDDALGD